MKANIQRSFFRNGQLSEVVPVRNGCKQGLARTWHKNGILASAERYQRGFLHGVCRQWDKAGRLLGKFTMAHGTGIQREWHDNGRLKIEISTVRGEFCGRNRIWLRDGTLISERFYLHGRVVSADDYRAAAAKNRTLPKYRGKPAKLPPKNRAMQKHVHRVFVSSLLEKPHSIEAAAWLQKETGEKTAHSLGRFKRERDALKFVQELYRAGAVEVIVPDNYHNKAGDRFADCLLVRLPKPAARRKAIRKACARLRRSRLGAFEPQKEIGESHLYLSLD